MFPVLSLYSLRAQYTKVKMKALGLLGGKAIFLKWSLLDCPVRNKASWFKIDDVNDSLWGCRKESWFQNCKYLSQFAQTTTFRTPKCLKLTVPYYRQKGWGWRFFPCSLDTCQIAELNLNGLNFVSWQPESQESAPLSLRKNVLFNIYELYY